MIIFLLTAWNIGISTDSENLGWYVIFGLLSNFVFTGQGYFIGVMVLNDNTPIMVNALFVMLLLATNGVLCNLKSANWFIVALSTISPTRFNCEGFLRVFIKQIPDLDKLLSVGGKSAVPISQD